MDIKMELPCHEYEISAPSFFSPKSLRDMISLLLSILCSLDKRDICVTSKPATTEWAISNSEVELRYAAYRRHAISFSYLFMVWDLQCDISTAR